MPIHSVSSCNELSFQQVSWCRPVCVTEAREVFISCLRRLRSMPTTIVVILLPKLIEDCNNVMPNGFIFQQDRAPAHTSRLAQDWLEQHRPDFIKKNEWPPNSPDLNSLDFHVWGAMLESTTLTCPSPRTKLN